ncbi:DUF484 family protein [Betaproteobacteria bacterium SCN1]|jgi:uncharacterized protein YigA (DUF484 family)|nr:DUF484 family protein [Betaproteobacteria bacterium SCN1]MBN8759000.1 DUF484 family protein [Thiobacillus sp.]ODU91083.1 MAG: hypothetical protein ABT21_03510 [Thiobacillus sp. SCN 65-179]OJW37985.1 MAG: hypothetical protein BGO61_10675 [Thiobacillus sp. 65-69]
MDTLDAPNKQAIADFLGRNPNFFNEYPTLLADLHIPHPHGTHAVSMSERQLIALRDKVRTLESKLAELIQFGEENDGISEKLHALTLDLVAAGTLQDLAGTLALHLREGFAVPHHAMHLLADGGLAPDAVTAIATLLQPVCGPLVVPQASDWFGEVSPHLKSFACIPLRMAAGSPSLGLLVLASEEEKRFYAGMGTLYLTRLGQTLAAALTRMQA